MRAGPLPRGICGSGLPASSFVPLPLSLSLCPSTAKCLSWVYRGPVAGALNLVVQFQRHGKACVVRVSNDCVEYGGYDADVHGLEAYPALSESQRELVMSTCVGGLIIPQIACAVPRTTWCLLNQGTNLGKAWRGAVRKRATKLPVLTVALVWCRHRVTTVVNVKPA